MKLLLLLILCVLSVSVPATGREEALGVQQYNENNRQTLEYYPPQHPRNTPLDNSPTTPGTEKKVPNFHNADERGDPCNLWPTLPVCGNE